MDGTVTGPEDKGEGEQHQLQEKPVLEIPHGFALSLASLKALSAIMASAKLKAAMTSMCVGLTPSSLALSAISWQDFSLAAIDAPNRPA
jgi:hypothetical protein